MRVPPPTFSTDELSITEVTQTLIVQDWGQVYDYILDNLNAGPVYLKIFNKTKAVVDAATVALTEPDEVFPLEGNKIGQTLPERFITKVHNNKMGICFCVTTEKGAGATPPGVAVTGKILYRKAHPITLS